MSRLMLFLLGPPRIERDQLLLSVDTRKATALIAYLAVICQEQSRDRLAALFWPEYDQTHARAALRRTLSTLQKALAGDWLVVEREMIGLRASPNLWIDVDAFSRLLAACRTHCHPAAEVCPSCVSLLAEAVALYRDDFLAGFSLRDSSAFDDWQFFQTEHLRRKFAHALERLVYGYSALGEIEAAIATAQRWLALDRLYEPAHRYLMQLYAWAGQRGAALHQYRACVQALEEELGVPPLEATTKLYQAIKENQIPPPPTEWQGVARAVEEKAARNSTPEASTSPDSVASSLPQYVNQAAKYPFVGRATEWSTLLNTYAASSASGQLVIIGGEAGIGKTRLAEEFLASLRSQGANVLGARCYEGETQLAYGPIAAGLYAALAGPGQAQRLEGIPAPWLSEAARLLPEFAALCPGVPPAPPLDNPGAQSRFFEGIRQVILAWCAGVHPGVLYFDNAHWADSASLELLTYLIRRLHDEPLYLLLTWRNDQTVSGRQLQQLQSGDARSNNVTLLSLARLSQSTVSELVQAVTPEQTALVERLYQETEGLPFFLIEYLTALEQGVLHAGSEEWSLPGGVRDLLRSRLNTLSETAWQLLTTAAVIGRSFDFDTLCQASGRSEEEAVIALEELLSQRLIKEVRNGTGERTLVYDFSHEKLRELVYDESSLARRRLLHRRVAEALVARTRGANESSVFASQIANHYRQAGNESAAAGYFKLAGERAVRLYANAEALAHFSTALALGHQQPAALHEAMGDLHTLLGEYSAALRSYETAAALCEPDMLAAIEQKLGTVYERRGDWELAVSHFEAALAALGEAEAREARSSLYADWSRTAHHQGQMRQALDLAQQALDLAEAAQDTRAQAKARNILGILASSRDDLEQARRHLEASLALAEQLADLGARVAALNNLALVCRASGTTERAIELTEAALALCVAQGDRHREAALHNNLADLLHSTGSTEAAMAHLKQAVSIYVSIDSEAGPLLPEIWKLTEW